MADAPILGSTKKVKLDADRIRRKINEECFELVDASGIPAGICIWKEVAQKTREVFSRRTWPRTCRPTSCP